MPRLRLRVVGADGGEQKRARCPGPLRAVVRGKDAKRVVEATFSAGRAQKRVDHRKPFRAQLQSSSKRIRVLAKLRDGRRQTLAAKPPRC